VQRSIIASYDGEHAYFPDIGFARPLTGRERKRKAMFAAIVRFIREWKKYNRSLAELSRLGDRELADIGISRSDIHRVAWNTAHQR
jgi:uncharacterized protein YjiS (DUF1127 family)